MPSAWRDGRAPVRRRILLIGLGTIALVAMHLWIGRDASVPRRSGPGDQWGYLGNARYLADSGPTWVLPEFPYFGYGYSALLIPAFWLFDDPERLFLAVRVTNALLLAFVFPLLVLFCRRVLKVARWPAVAGGLAGALVPGAIAHSSLAVAENLVLPLVVFASLSCWALLTDRPAWQRLAFAPSIVALVVTHDRFVPAPAIMAAVLVVGVVRGLVPRRIAAVNAAMAAALLLGASALRGRIVEARWVDGIETPQGPVSEAFEVLTSWSNLGDFVMEMVGQVWYVAAGTLGLGLIGLVSLSSQVGRTSLNVEADARRFTIVFVLLSAVSVLLISSYFFYRAKNPSEGYIVGRHNDSFVPIWAATGVAFLLGERVRRRVLNAALACVGILVVLAAVLVLVRDRADWELIYYSTFRAPAVYLYARTRIGVVPSATAVAVGMLLMIVALVVARVRAGVLVPIACAWIVIMVASTIKVDQSFDDWELPEQFAEVDVTRAAVVHGRSYGMPKYYPYFLPELEPVTWDGRGEPPETFVFSPIPGSDLERFGGRLILIDEGLPQPFGPAYSMGLWVMPGPELDEYRRNGQLLPTPDG